MQYNLSIVKIPKPEKKIIDWNICFQLAARAHTHKNDQWKNEWKKGEEIEMELTYSLYLLRHRIQLIPSLV